MRLALHAPPPKRRFVKKSSREVSWRALHRVADKHYPALRDLFAKAWGAMVAAIDREALDRALTAHNLPEVLLLLEDAWSRSTEATLRDPLRQLMQGIVAQSAVASQPALQRLVGPQVAVAFNTASPQVLGFIQDHSATLIREIGDETRQAIRSLLLEAMESGQGWRSIVPALRETIGVTRRQAEALGALRARAEAQGLKAAQIERMVAQKTRRYKQLRARTIGRDQSMLAANAGQFLQMQQLVAQGAMDPMDFRRHVVITPDDRLCQVCKDIKAQNIDGVPLLSPFQTPDGPKMYPPFHVICRCTTVTRPVRSL